MPTVRIAEALEEIREGKMVILVDDEDRENEGDLCMAAELVTPEAVNFMAKYGRGLICLSLTEKKVEELQLPTSPDSELPSPFLLRRDVELAPGFQRLTGPLPLRRRWFLMRGRRIWLAPAMCSLCGLEMAVYWCEPVRRRAPLIWHGWPDWGPRGLFARL